MKSKLTLLILLILSVSVAHGSTDFEENPNSVNYLKLGNPTINDFNRLDAGEQHKVYSDKNNIGRCSECDDDYFGGEASRLNMQRNPDSARVYIRNLAGMDVDISQSLGQIAVVNGEVINPPGSSLIKNLIGVMAAANKEGGFTYIKSGKTINVVGNEQTVIEFKDNFVVTSSGAKIDLSDLTSIKIDNKEHTIISINQNKIKFGKDAKFDLVGNRIIMGKNVVGDIKKGDDWANFRTFDSAEAVLGTNGNYALKGNFFYAGKNDIGIIAVPTVVESSLREKEIEKGLDIVSGERRPISLCVGDCEEFKAFLGSNQVLISNNQVSVKAFGSVDVFGKDGEIFSLVGQHEKADFVIERFISDDKLFITQKNTPPLTEKEFEAEVKRKHEERITKLEDRQEELQKKVEKETNTEAKTKLQNQIKEVERLIDREQKKYDNGKGSKSIDYGFVSYSKGNTLIVGYIGGRQYVGARYEGRDFYPITTELNQITYQHSALGEEEKYFTIITQSNDPNLNTKTEAYEGYTIMEVIAGEMEFTDNEGEITTSRGRNLKGNIKYYTLTKTPIAIKDDMIEGSVVLNPRGAIERATTLDSREFGKLEVGKITMTQSKTTADLDFDKIPSSIFGIGPGAELKEKAAQTLRDIFSEASLKNPEDISKGFESLGLGEELVNTLKARAPEIIDRVVTDPKLKNGIYAMNFEVEKIGSDSAKVTISFKPSSELAYTTILNGFDYSKNYGTILDKLKKGDITKQAISELNKQKEKLLESP